MKSTILLFLLGQRSASAFVKNPIILQCKQPVPLDSNFNRVRCGSSLRSRDGTPLNQTGSTEGENVEQNSAIEKELERLQEQLSLIEALEARNESQLDSFVDEEDQWDSLEEDEKVLLNSKESVVERMDLLAEQMIMLWMGQKSQDG